jgi:hypothetical protein
MASSQSTKSCDDLAKLISAFHHNIAKIPHHTAETAAIRLNHGDAGE